MQIPSLASGPPISKTCYSVNRLSLLDHHVRICTSLFACIVIHHAFRVCHLRLKGVTHFYTVFTVYLQQLTNATAVTYHCYCHVAMVCHYFGVDQQYFDLKHVSASHVESKQMCPFTKPSWENVAL
jgi:hypothetical protein